MEFKQLECFVNVARKKSFSKAADILFLSQPAITNNIQNLEKELGTRLFERNKTIDLTEKGFEFLPYAIEMLNIRDKSKMEMTKQKDIEGILEIYASSIPAQYLLPHIIKAFKEIYPKVLFYINHEDSKIIADEVLSGVASFGFIGARYPNEKINYIDFYKDKLVLIASPEKTFDSLPLDIEDLIGQDIVLREEGSGTRLLIENALREKDLDLSIFNSQAVSFSLESIKKMVSLNIGISFSSEISVKDEVESGRLKQYQIKGLNLNRDFSLIYCNNRYLSPLELKFKEFISSWQWDDKLSIL